MRLRTLAAVLIACLLSASLRAAAQTDGERTEEDARARALFKEGVEQADEGHWQKAADRFERALALRDTPQIRYNLAQALGRVGRVVEAMEHLTQIERRDEGSAEVQDKARELKAKLEKRVGQLEIRVEGQNEGLRITLDGKRVREPLVGVPMPADPGRHTVRLFKRDRELDTRQVELLEGGEATVVLQAPAPAPSPRQAARAAQRAEESSGGVQPSADANESSGRLVRQWWFWTAIGAVAAAGLAVGIGVAASDDGEQPTQSDLGRIEFR